VATFFSEFFDVDPAIIDAYGAFNVSLINDLPLFIDPFLLFNSDSEAYNELHDHIIKYLVFLKNKSASYQIDPDLLESWYCFKEVKQNWLGFSVSGNGGSGLGPDFARALHANLYRIFSDFGSEKITRGSHLEKVCLVKGGVGRDNISDFTTNLIKDYLCKYTEEFSIRHIKRSMLKNVWVNKAKFNFSTESWDREQYTLPWLNDDYVILTPKDILTRDDTWINRRDLVSGFQDIPDAIPDAQLRAQVFNYFMQVLASHKDKAPSKRERDDAAAATILQYPQIIDYYIKIKEDRGDEAFDISTQKVYETEQVFIDGINKLQNILCSETLFYQTGAGTYEEAHRRLAYLKDVIENKGGHKLFYHDGKSVEREKDLQILYRLVWYGTPSDVTTEANDGRGPVDFKISKGAFDKTLVEMKLAKNSQLERNLQNQVQIYQAASDAKQSIKAIIFFSEQEKRRAQGILDKLGLLDHKDVVLIDARDDNKPSGSKA
jgi:hypothetical protein